MEVLSSLSFFALLTFFIFNTLIYHFNSISHNLGEYLFMCFLMIMMCILFISSLFTIKRIVINDKEIIFYRVIKKQVIPFTKVVKLQRMDTITWRSGEKIYYILYEEDGKIKRISFTFRYIEKASLLVKKLRVALKHVPQKNILRYLSGREEEDWPANKI
jgi:hypothetical protein